MDAQKLLRILRDAQKDEETIGLNSKLDEIRSHVAQNNQDGFTAADKTLTELLAQIKEKSITGSFSRTETLLLAQIGGEQFFGVGLIAQLNGLLTSRSFELVAKIDQFRKERKEFLRKLQGLSASLTDIGLVEYRPTEYEIGVVLPEEEAGLENLRKRLRDLEILLSALIEIVGGDQQKVRVSRLSNGSLEFFSLQGAEVALLFTSLLLNISGIWDKIEQFRKNVDEVEKNPLLGEDAKKEIKAVFKKEAEKLKAQILEQLPEQTLEQFKGDKAARNLIRNKVSVAVRLVFGWFEAGIQVDVTPVRVENPPEATEENVKVLEAIKETSNRLREIYLLPPDARKLPFELPAPDEDKAKGSEKK